MLLCHCLVGSSLKLWLEKNLHSCKNCGGISTQDGGREREEEGKEAGTEENEVFYYRKTIYPHSALILVVTSFSHFFQVINILLFRNQKLSEKIQKNVSVLITIFFRLSQNILFSVGQIDF